MGNMLEKVDRSLAPSFPGRKSVLKRQRYNWAKPSQMGTFMMVGKHDLNLEEAYQRSVTSDDRVRNIAANLDWRRFGALLVIMRKDGSLWVYDGGHRIRAAYYRDDVKEVPCLVFEASEDGEDTLREEARAFIDVNETPSKVSSVQRFYAGIVAGNEVDIAAQRIVKKYGYHVPKGGSGSKGAYVFSSVNSLKNIIEHDEDLAERVFCLCAKIADGERIPNEVLTGLATLARKMNAKRESVDVLDAPYVDSFVRAGVRGMAAEIMRERTIVGKGGALVSAKALLNLVNKGRRSRRIEWD